MLSGPQGHSATGSLKSMKNPDTRKLRLVFLLVILLLGRYNFPLERETKFRTRMKEGLKSQILIFIFHINTPTQVARGRMILNGKLADILRI
jgi:hypothetical protein